MPSHILRRERKSGVRWTVRFPTGVLDENGKPKLQIKTFRYQRDAKEYLKTLEDAKTEGKPVTESEQTLKAFLDEYLEATDLRDTTRDSYREVIGLYIEPTLGKTPLRDVTPMKVQRLYTKLRKTLSPRTVRYAHSILRSGLDHAVAVKLIRSNPAHGLKLPKKDAPEIRYLRGEEIPAFLIAAREDMYGALFEFLLACGCRPGEARGLMWSDIDWKEGTVEIQRTVSDAKPWKFNQPKTAKGKRTLGLPDKTVEMLKAHKAEQDENMKWREEIGEPWEALGLVFCSPSGQPLDRRNLANKHLKKIYRQVAEELYPAKTGKDDERVCACNLYSLRHTSATRLVEAGVNLRTVSERLGHKDVTTTLEQYVHSTPTMAKQAVKEISKAMYS